MENEQTNQQPTYEQLAQAYNQVFTENQQLRVELVAAKTDRFLEKMTLLTKIMENRKNYSVDILDLVEWHLKQMLNKPKEEDK